MIDKKTKVVLSTAREVIGRLRVRYPAGAYALLEQVGDSTGARHHRWADAVVMSLWPSRGLEVIGIEVKVRRSDWLKELATPEKADAIAKNCDRWYLAVGDEAIVQDGELPKGWGLLVPKADGLRCKVEAKLVEPEPVQDRGFIAAVLRQAQCQITEEAVLKREYERGFGDGKREEKEYQERFNHDKEELVRLTKKVKDFEKASGVSIINCWNAGNVGEAVNSVLNGYHTRIKDQLEELHGKALKIATHIENELQINHNGTPV